MQKHLYKLKVDLKPHVMVCHRRLCFNVKIYVFKRIDVKAPSLNLNMAFHFWMPYLT